MKKLFLVIFALSGSITFAAISAEPTATTKKNYQLKTVKTIENEKFPVSFKELKRFLDDNGLDEPILWKGGGAHWPMMRLTPNFLKEHYGSSIVDLDMSLEEHFNALESEYSKQYYIGCEGYLSEDFSYANSTVCYPTDNPGRLQCDLLYLNTEIIQNNGFPLSDKKGQAMQQYMFLGKGASGSPFHVHNPFIFCQIYGQKTFYLVNHRSCATNDNICATLDPQGVELVKCTAENKRLCSFVMDEELSQTSLEELIPELYGIDIRKITLERGDVLYCPYNWFHRTINGKNDISIGMSQFLFWRY